MEERGAAGQRPAIEHDPVEAMDIVLVDAGRQAQHLQRALGTALSQLAQVQHVAFVGHGMKSFTWILLSNAWTKRRRHLAPPCRYWAGTRKLDERARRDTGSSRDATEVRSPDG